MSRDQEIVLTAPDNVEMAQVVGAQDENLRMIERAFDARITIRGNHIRFVGAPSDVTSLCTLFNDIFQHLQNDASLSLRDIRRMIDVIHIGSFAPSQLHNDVVLSYRGKTIRPKTTGQKHYVDSIRDNTVTFGIGPAGTGKTYLAMAMAVAALKRKDVSRIILTRPVVEAGENLGYLPGTLSEKVDPYIRPLYDALFDMTDPEEANGMLQTGVIEIAPLAFMRGRTLNDSFIVLDEAQNTTSEQMKMFLTRLGFGSKMVVNGDISQIDLTRGISGLRQVQHILQGVEGIHFVNFHESDVVRHSLVAAIVGAYTSYERRNERSAEISEQTRAHALTDETGYGQKGNASHAPQKKRRVKSGSLAESNTTAAKEHASWK